MNVFVYVCCRAVDGDTIKKDWIPKPREIVKLPQRNIYASDRVRDGWYSSVRLHLIDLSFPFPLESDSGESHSITKRRNPRRKPYNIC
jgi:hypothetical protein